MIEKSKNILPIFIGFLIFNFIFADPPNWDSDGDGVIDNYTDFANSGSVTGLVLINDVEVTELGDMVGAFVGEELRGVGVAEVVPEALGGGYSFNILVYSNETQGEMITFKFYYSSIDLVIDLNESIEFISDMVVGNVIFPQILTGSYEEIYGCIDEIACNYDSEATVDDGSCEYAEENYDCDGNCAADVDCLGECGGLAVVDECGECGGDGIDDGTCDCAGNVEDCAGECAGLAVVDECGECGGDGIDDGTCDCAGNIFDCAGECGGLAVVDECGECGGGNTGIEECESVNYNIPLHIGANLISFYSLPTTNSLSEILYPNTQDFIFSVLGESMMAVNTGNNNWSGSLSNFYLEDGYWVRALNVTDISINQAYEIEVSPYNLHAGANLISYPSNTSILLEDALPDSLESNFLSILGEGVLAIRLEDGSWTGSLQYFEPNKGYWFIINEAMEFSYNLDQALPRSFITEENNKKHIQSSEQAFYYIDNLEELPLDVNDWIIVENDGIITGSRFMNNLNKDIPVMGDDLSNYTQGYCTEGDFPNFKILKSDNTVVNLFGEIPPWENMGIYVIDLFTFVENSNHPLQIDLIEMFPNPFNPIVNIDFNTNIDGNIKVDIFDVNGRFVSTVVDNQLSSGNHKFTWNADNYNSGIYFIRISSQTESIIRKITLIK